MCHSNCNGTRGEPFESGDPSVGRGGQSGMIFSFYTDKCVLHWKTIIGLNADMKRAITIRSVTGVSERCRRNLIHIFAQSGPPLDRYTVWLGI